jgi:hypothetical protein
MRRIFEEKASKIAEQSLKKGPPIFVRLNVGNWNAVSDCLVGEVGECRSVWNTESNGQTNKRRIKRTTLRGSEKVVKCADHQRLTEGLRTQLIERL